MKSGNNNDSVSEKNVEEVAGKSGNALKLNGGESYVETPVDMVGTDKRKDSRKQHFHVGQERCSQRQQ